MTGGLIDFHTHAFPDDIAVKAIPFLENEGGIKARLNGTVSDLIGSMDRNGIEKSIICSIATKPSQFESIFEWSRKIRSERIIPFPSIHPEDPRAVERVSQLRKEGFSGVKFHPYYQDFRIDDEKLFPLYNKLSENNMLVVMHTGFDFAFEKHRIADPEKIHRLVTLFPELKIITTHLGAWDDWDEVQKHLLGKKIYMEISFSLEYLDQVKAREMMLSHPKEHILFGSDSPWADQAECLVLLRGLNLGEELERLILRENAAKLLDSV